MSQSPLQRNRPVDADKTLAGRGLTLEHQRRSAVETQEMDAPVFNGLDTAAAHDGSGADADATLVLADAESLRAQLASEPESRLPPPPSAAPVSVSRAGGRGPWIGFAAVAVAAIAVVTGAVALRPRAPRPVPSVPRAVASPPAVPPNPVATPSPIEYVTVVTPPGPTPHAPAPDSGASPERGGPSLPTPPPPAGDPPEPSRPTSRVVTDVADLMAQAAHALAANDPDAALARYAEVLAIEPGNEAAVNGTLLARGARAAVGRFFETQPTVRDVARADEMECEWGPCAKARVLDCKLEYQVVPLVPVPGEPYAIEVTAVNTGGKTLKLRSADAVLFRNGAQAPHALTPAEREIARGERKRIARVEDVWAPGTTSWWLEVTVTDQKGDRYRAQFTWELPRTLSR